MTCEDLEAACIAFEEEHGVDGFLSAMTEIMQRRMVRHGIVLQFFDDDEAEPDFRPVAISKKSVS